MIQRAPRGAQSLAAGPWPAAVDSPSGSALRLAAYAVSTLAAVLWTLYAGKDVNWDAMNHHLYAGFSAVNDRFAVDFFAAGAASYFNPLSQVPFYWMIAAGVPALAIGVALASAHASMLWITYELALAVNPDPRGRQVVAMVAMLLAALNPVFVQAVGSSFNDITAGAFTLGAWLALVRARDPRGGALALAGALLGVATALKLSNALFAIAALPMLVMLPGARRAGAKGLLLFGGAGVAAFAIVAGPWALKLWHAFGNPMFPMFNAYFASPDFITDALKHERFTPDSVASAMFRPFHMALSERMIHTEPRAADVRYAALLLVFAWTGASIAMRSLVRPRQIFLAASGNAADASHDPTPQGPTPRALIGLIASFAVAWTLWLCVSGNSRYFIPMGCVAGVILASLVFRWSPSMRLAGYLACGLVLTQVAAIALGSQLRWTREPWGGAWFQVTLPERFAREPNLYLSLDMQSSSFLLPWLAPGSGLVNVSGSYVLGPGRPGGDRVQRMIDARRGHVRSLLPVARIDDQGRPLPPSIETVDGRVLRFGLRTDAGDCAFFRMEGSGGLGAVAYTDTRGAMASRSDQTHFFTCALVPVESGVGGYRAEEARVDRVFDNVEKACPSLFHPPHTVSERNQRWGRHYALGSDVNLWIHDGTVKYSNPAAGGDAVEIGRASDWEQSAQPIDCSKRRGARFAGVLD